MTDKTPMQEATVTAQDLQNRWNEIKQTVRHETERRVLGMTYKTAGGILLGAGALGVAFWLGRRAAMTKCRQGMRSQQDEDLIEVETPRARCHKGTSRVSRVLEPALDNAVNTVVNAAVQSAVNAVTKRLRHDNE